METPAFPGLTVSQLGAILETVDGAVITLDEQQVIRFVNAAAARLFGYERDALLGKSCHVLMKAEHHSAHDRGFQKFSEPNPGATAKSHVEVRGLRQDGSEFPLALHFTVAEVEGKRLFTAAASDLTEEHDRRDALATEVRERTAELGRQHERLMQAEKMASLGQLVAGVAHEVNTPLGAIKSNNDTSRRTLERLGKLLDAERPTPEERAKIQKLFEGLVRLAEVDQDAVERIEAIVLSLRKFARLDTEEVDAIDLHAALDDTLTLLCHHLKRGVEVHREYGNVPQVECRGNQINQVFMNLLVNAIQAIENQGDITVHTEASTNREGQPTVTISIRDNGSGIQPEHLSKIFEPGFTTKRVGVGTGLGLSIVQRIVEDHGGELAVESNVGQGTTFTVTLPVKLSRRAEEPESV